MLLKASNKFQKKFDLLHQLSNYAIVISVKKIILISLLGRQCCNKVRRQTAQAQVLNFWQRYQQDEHKTFL